jgi:hypothetical protein
MGVKKMDIIARYRMYDDWSVPQNFTIEHVGEEEIGERKLRIPP